ACRRDRRAGRRRAPRHRGTNQGCARNRRAGGRPQRGVGDALGACSRCSRGSASCAGGASRQVGQRGAGDRAARRRAGSRVQARPIRLAARPPEPDHALVRLGEAGLLFCRGAARRSSYLFRHLLLRDALYGSLPSPRRQQLHARVATVLEQRFPELAEREPELLAAHLGGANEPGQAIEYWFKAGEQAKKRAADREAVALLRTALRLTEELPDPFERAAWELRISIALGPALMTAEGSAAPEVARVYARARELAEEGGRMARLFQALWGSWLASF